MHSLKKTPSLSIAVLVNSTLRDKKVNLNQLPYSKLQWYSGIHYHEHKIWISKNVA